MYIKPGHPFSITLLQSMKEAQESDSTCMSVSELQQGSNKGREPAAGVCRLLPGGLFGHHIGHKTVGPSLAIRLIQSIRLHHCHLCMQQHMLDTIHTFISLIKP